MSEAVLASSTSNRLESFVLLSKSAKGAACAKLIQDALSAAGVYVFAELLESPHVQELKGTDHEPYLKLLELFAYGTYDEYKAHAASLPQLNETQIRKLKHLSIVSMSGTNRTLQYDTLQLHLDVANVRELEDLIIDAIYQDVVKGKLDQKRKALEVEYAMGRDLKPGESQRILQTLEQWSNNTDSILKAIDEQKQIVAESAKRFKKEKDDYEKLMEAAKKEAKSAPHTRSGHHEAFDMRPDYCDYGEGDRRSGKR
ncbi:hypothetical protein HDV00_002586 [Rhizophlyctis rosea]|nr:hypothetical protein HDV00_002586 [Rhizophlyctis rosea]